MRAKRERNPPKSRQWSHILSNVDWHETTRWTETLQGYHMIFTRNNSMRYSILSSICGVACLAIGSAHAEVASTYGGSDGLCGHRTANGERLNCGAMTAAHRTLPFGSLVRVCHQGCVVVRINDLGPFVRGRNIDLSPAAAHAIGLNQTGYVTLNR